ncbi:DUF6788 family protein [Dictyobacter arantiisoli]|uniref:Bacterial transcriptional activator domain-containing protein n=1 Tax=Dictyobacter arantiisoli TaxID=2014874 RepID=A0A5A5T6D3_9CHLR|nr:DUF6788 family protein [Dictyobacter arantiisoli]GCF06942.1 hypothetical protein KDI_05060 [Dictyobacter arantiisoli]
MTQPSKITYHQQVTYCGKPRCRRCQEGIGHGPYWYAYQTIDGRTTRKYIGKHLPPDVQASLDTPSITTGDSAMASNISTLSSRISRSTSGVDGENVVLRISTLGQFRLEQRDQTRSRQKKRNDWSVVNDTAWQKRSARALLAYLICCPGRSANRSQALVALWPNDDLNVANGKLNDALTSLRRALGHPSVKADQKTPPTTSERLLTDGDWFTLAGQKHIWIDIDEFERLTAQIEQADDQLPDYEDVLQHAIALYHGDFLPEERTAEWSTALRQRLRRKWADLLLKSSSLYITRKDYTNAINVLNNLLIKDPTNELAIQQLIRVLIHQRRRVEAIQAYRSFADTLQRDYKAHPSIETRALYDAIRSGRTLDIQALTDATAPLPLEEAEEREKPRPSSKEEARAHHLVMPLPSSAQIGRRHHSPLVGRDTELQMMRALLRQIEQNARLQMVGSRRLSGIPLDTQRQPQLLLLKGGVGIGKTRLAEELGRDAQHNGWNIVWNRVYQQESGIPYRVWIEALRKILIAESSVLSLLNIEAVRALATLPGLLDTLHTDIDVSLSPHILMPEQSKYTLYTAISELLKLASEHGPLLIVLDDIQWVDVSSYELLGHLARQLTGYGIAFLATCRDGEASLASTHAFGRLILEMQREHTIQPIEVQPLSPEHIKQLVTNLSDAAAVTDVSEHRVENIQQRASGNPLFAEELIHAPSSNKLPENVMEALSYHMKRLSTQCHELLIHASILGGSFEMPVLCALETGSEIDEDDSMLTLIEEALKEGVVTTEGSGTRITYHFWHPLLVELLYDDPHLSLFRRARLHQRAADVIVRINRGREEEVAATVTRHLELAGAEAAQIAYYAELAGNSAYRVSAFAEAASYYQKAVGYLEKEGAHETPSYLMLLERLAECEITSDGDYAQARKLFERVLKLRNQIKSADDTLAEIQIQALLWDQISWTWRYQGNIWQAWECIAQEEKLLQQAQVVGGPVLSRLYYTQSNLYNLEGHCEQALQMAQQALTLFEADQKQRSLPVITGRQLCKTQTQRIIEGYPDLLGRLQRHVGAVAVFMGQLRQALDYQNRALVFSEQYKELRQIAHVSSNIGFIYIKMADYKQAQAVLRRALHLAESVGDRALLSLVLSNLGELDAAQGNLAQAEEQYRKALELKGDPEYTSRWNAGLAGVLQAQGNLRQATTCVCQAFYVARSMQNAPCMGQALVALGNIRIAQAQDSTISQQKQSRLLVLAQKDIQWALALKVEAETRMKGNLALALVAALQGKSQQARQGFEEVCAEAQGCEYMQIVTHAQELLARYC